MSNAAVSQRPAPAEGGTPGPATRSRVDPANVFALAVMGAGVVFAVVLALIGDMGVFGHLPVAALVFLILVVLGEMFVLRLPSRTNDVLLSASSIFAYATALRYGPGVAMGALAIGTLAKGTLDRRAPIKTGFNVAQHSITVGVAGLVYQALGGGLGIITEHDVAPALGGAVVYLSVNYALTGIVVALATGARIHRQLVQGLGIWLPVEGVMLSFSPIVPVVAERSLWLIPLLLVPFLGVFYSSRIAVRAEHASLHDALTGLPNRVLFRMRVEQALVRAHQVGGRVLIMVLDLDRFKEVNDTLGHGRGDELLKALAERLGLALREADVVARLGGDEFGVVLSYRAGWGNAPEQLAERIRQALAPPFALGDLWVTTGTSIGMAIYPLHGHDAERLIVRADVAMYSAKQSGTGAEQYDPDRDPNRPDNLRLAQELREGLERGELVLHYQPKVCVATGRVTGLEALARWNHPERGLMMPVHFIELAERTELVRSLTLEVARQAARQGAEWMRLGMRLPIAINLSPRILLDVALATDIAVVLAEEGLPAELLEVEVTESCLVADPERTAEVLGRLSATGVRISIDDFGTGYSSLALLKSLPVDTIKIDRSFVMRLAENQSDRVIVESTIKLGAGLGLTVVAEGVEDEAALKLLDDFACAQAQGYHICRPKPAGEIDEWLRGGQRAEHLLSAGTG